MTSALMRTWSCVLVEHLPLVGRSAMNDILTFTHRIIVTVLNEGGT